MAQSTTTNRRLARLLLLWIAQANSSLPVPVSPEMSTLASLAADRASRSSERRMGALTPTISPRVSSLRVV